MFNAIAVAAWTAETTEATEEIEQLVTQYSDLKVPMFKMIMVPFCCALLIAIVIAGLIILRNRTHSWGSGMITGITAYLLLSVVCMLAQVGISALPATKEFFTAHAQAYSLLISALSLVMECVVIYFGMYYVKNQADKQNRPINIGSPLAFGLAFYTVMVVMGGQLTNLVQEFLYSSMVNTEGFDSLLSSMVASGIEQPTAEQELLDLVQNSPFAYLCDVLCTVAISVVVTCAAIMCYGVLTEKLDKKWNLAAMGFVVLSSISSFTSIYVSNMLVLFLIAAAVAAFSVIVTIRLVKEHMQDDITMMSYTRSQRKKDEDEEKKKMPKIVMPKD